MGEATVDVSVKQDETQEDWQAMKSNWKGRMSHLFNNEVMSDVTFKVQDERFKAHKLVMASASSVFYAMFYGSVAEKRSEIEIVDCPNSEDFTEFLKFVYTEELSLTWDNVFAVAYLAKKYYIPSLTDQCCQFLLRSLTMKNVLSVLNRCTADDQQEMAKECLRLITVRIRELSRTQDFLELSRDSLKAILELDVLDMEEVDLFLAVDKWCKHQLEREERDVTPEAKREIFREVSYLVRFPAMSLDLLANCLPSGLMTNEQFVDVVSFLSSKDPDKYENIDKEKIPYKTTPRTRSNYSVNCETEATGYSDSYGSCFRVSEKVWLKGLTVKGRLFANRKVIIIKGRDGTKRKPDISIQYAGEDRHTERSHLIFETPVEILPGVEYNVLDIEKREAELGCSKRFNEFPGGPNWRGASKSSYGQIRCEIVSPFCQCWGPSWERFPEMIFSKHDDLQIPEEEAILCEKAN